MVPMLTDQQRLAINAVEGSAAVPVIDPVDHRTYYLVTAEHYEQLREESSTSGSALDTPYALMDDVARQEGWDDPEMCAYDPLDPRKPA